ncbi:Clp protease N-terminal domain-containing protein [Streptomyces sp. NPDC057199]|uniref:Clp protease N-terminal domain-containing protein n=1 Tax=Streptomyces sp. NPDC057199 TaxID=3346047 RepID=UPI003635611B
MFERFTRDARAVVLGAVEHAERLHAETVEEQHVLLALLDREASRASFALMSLGLAERKESVEQALAEARRRGGLSRADADALSGLGIDVSEIVSRVEEAHGEGALRSRGGTGTGRGRGWLSGLVGGHRPFAQGAKDLLTESLRMALAQRDRYIGDEHLLLALAARPGVPAEVLADHGVTYESLRRVLYGGGEAKAG